jgi:hypothetical protein
MTKDKFLMVLFSVLILGLTGMARAEEGEGPKPDSTAPKAYEPTVLQKQNAIDLVRIQTIKGLKEAKKKEDENKKSGEDVEKDNQPNLAKNRVRANKVLVELEAYQKELSKAYGGPLPDSLFDEAKKQFMEKDFNAVNNSFNGKLNEGIVKKYVDILKLYNWDLNYMDEIADKTSPLFVHLKPEELKNEALWKDAGFTGDEKGVAEKVSQVAMKDFLDEWKMSREGTPTPDSGVSSVNSGGKIEEAQWDAHQQKIIDDLWNSYGKRENEGNEAIRTGFRLADYRILTQGSWQYEKQTKTPLAQPYVEIKLSDYLMHYQTTAMQKSLLNFDFSVGEVLGDIAVGVAKDVAADAVKSLLGF